MHANNLHPIIYTNIFLQAHPQIPMPKIIVVCNKKIREVSPNWPRITKVGRTSKAISTTYSQEMTPHTESTSLILQNFYIVRFDLTLFKLK